MDAMIHCYKCDNVFNSSHGFVAHYRGCRGRRFRCGHCDEVFDNNHSFIDHMFGKCSRAIDKKDENKPRWSLLPAGTIERIVAVLEFGAKKYQVDNWQDVPDARRRYYDAVMRHIEAWWRGEKHDLETGIHHLAHAATCLLFLMWFDSEEKSDVVV